MEPIENLFISDEDYTASNRAYITAAMELQQLLDEYLQTMQYIVMEKVMAGKTADNMLLFAQQVGQALGKQLNALVDAHRANMTHYIAEIDEADQMLYGGD